MQLRDDWRDVVDALRTDGRPALAGLPGRTASTSAAFPFPLLRAPRSGIRPVVAGLLGTAIVALAAISIGGLPLLARWSVGLVLVWAGVAKLVDVPTFARRLRRLPLVPRRLRSARAALRLARAVCFTELLLGTLFVIGFAPAIVGACVVALLLLFTAVLAIAVRRGDASPCGCLGAASSSSPGRVELARNTGLIVLAVVALADRPGTHAGASVAAALVAGVAAASFAVVQRPARRRIAVHAPFAGAGGLLRVVSGMRRSQPEPVVDPPEMQARFAELADLAADAARVTVALDGELTDAAEPPTAGRPRPLPPDFDQREAALLDADEEINRRFERLYGEAVQGDGRQTLARVALLHWTVLLRRRGMHGRHTAVEGLVDDPDCGGDLIGDDLLQRYFDAVVAEEDSGLSQQRALEALALIARQAACIGAQQSALLASDLYWSYRDLRAFLHAHALEAVLPVVAQAGSSPLLFFYDVEKWRGISGPLGRWFAEQREALAQSVATGRHPAYWHGLWLYDRRSGHLIGYHLTDQPVDENDVDLEAFFASIVDPVNIGRGDCSFAEMIQRGASRLGYVCAGRPCRDTTQQGTSGSGRLPKLVGQPSGGLLDSPALEILCKAASPREGGSDGCGGADLGGGWSREADMVRCVSQRVLQPGEAQMRCVAEATGRCAGPLDTMAKTITQALFGGVKIGTRCLLAETDTNDELVTVELPNGRELTGTTDDMLKLALNESKDAQMDALDYLKGLEEAQAEGDTELAGWLQERFDNSVGRMNFWDSVAADMRQRQGTGGKSGPRGGTGGVASTGRCPPDTPECGDNGCTAMSEWARNTMACFQEPAGTVHPTDPAGSGVFDPLESAATGGLPDCFGTLLRDAEPSSRQCWYYDCGPSSMTVAGAGGCGCREPGGLGGPREGLPGTCGALDCADGVPRFDGTRCTCAPTTPASGPEALAPFELTAVARISDVHLERLETLVPPYSLEGARILITRGRPF